MFCASQASTAICMSMDQSSSSSTIHLGSSRAIDRHNPIIRDAYAKRTSIITTPCSSQPAPFTPKPINHQKITSRKSTSTSNSKQQSSTDQNKIKKNSAKASTSHDQKGKSKNIAKSSNDKSTNIRKSCAKPSDLFSPPGSSRYLLRENSAFYGVFSDFDPLSLVPVEPNKADADQIVKSDESSVSKPASSSLCSNQVVVLRVSLHCKGCERKVRKHISRMEGVTSFNTDFASKKVTVIGDVTPLSVLASVSKVKNAQLWTPPLHSSSSAVNKIKK